ncbi:MAG: hypothetical protein JWO91_409 [Acidobacteriaceae bacterium]|nr:hypothetical protein [Acidobacteriaceae bacterium]
MHLFTAFSDRVDLRSPGAYDVFRRISFAKVLKYRYLPQANSFNRKFQQLWHWHCRVLVDLALYRPFPRAKRNGIPSPGA